GLFDESFGYAPSLNQTARPIGGLEDAHARASLGQIPRGGETGQAGANHMHDRCAHTALEYKGPVGCVVRRYRAKTAAMLRRNARPWNGIVNWPSSISANPSSRSGARYARASGTSSGSSATWKVVISARIFSRRRRSSSDSR